MKVSLEEVPKSIIPWAILRNVGKHLNDVFDVDIANNEENDEGEFNPIEKWQNAWIKLGREEKRQHLNIQYWNAILLKSVNKGKKNEFPKFNLRN